MHHAQVIPTTAARTRRHPAQLLPVFWLLAIGLVWWAVARRQLADAGMGEALAPLGGAPTAGTIGWLAASTVLGRYLSVGLEALFYQAWWRSWGAPFRFGPFYLTVASLSLIDAASDTLQALVREGAPGLGAWLAPVLGLGLLRDPAAPGDSLAVAFGSLGIFTAVRVVLTARAEAREIGRRIGVPLLFTVLLWLVTRVVVWWGIDLARGMSPLP